LVEFTSAVPVAGVMNLSIAALEGVSTWVVEFGGSP